MIKLYYSPFSCSLCVHIALELAGADYEAVRVKTGSDEYKKIAPKGAVPAIVDSENNLGVMTQNVALLKYIARKYDKSGILGSDGTLEGDYKLNNLLAFINSDLHTSFGGGFAPSKYTTKTDEDSINGIKEAATKRIERQLGFLEELLNGKLYLIGDKLSIADLYAFVVSNWANFVLPEKLEKFPNIVKFQENMMKNDKIMKIIKIHGEEK